MKILEQPDQMQRWSQEQRRDGRRIAFVPTMGYLHEGHLSLMREAKRRADRLVVSIFVNPAQFGPNEDLSRYPRDLEGDLAKCRDEGCDALFVPGDSAIYPKGYRTYVEVEGVTAGLCGASRPGHFRGVATVVLKLFNIVTPDCALFGEKDYQQLIVIRSMVRDLNLPIEVIGCPIVREPDGLAMSSRNRYLSAEERKTALSLSRSLDLAQRRIDAGERDAAVILREVRSTLASAGIARTDYAKIVDAETLEEIAALKAPALLAIAAFVGKTRLIDNRRFDLSPQ